jgi:hypothetical protein
MIGGIDGTNARAVAVDTSGRLQVEILQVIPQTGSGDLGKSDAVTYAAGHTGIAMLAVRRDAHTTTVVANQKYINPSADKAGVLLVRPRAIASYSAVWRAPYTADAVAASMSVTFSSAGIRKPFATIHHTASSLKDVYIRKVVLSITSCANATFYEFEVLAINALPTGGTTITPQAHEVGDAKEAALVCMAQPTGGVTATAGLLAGDSPVGVLIEWFAGITATGGATNPDFSEGCRIILFDAARDGVKPLKMRAGIAEGWAVYGRSTIPIVVLSCIVSMEFTEETA